MSRYIVTNGSYFNPMSYDDLMKPIQALETQHEAAADAYDTLNLETEAIRQYISENPGDSRALQIYNNYSQKLNALQNNLWERGVTAQTRRDLASARSAFGEMSKVRTAIENRQARSKEYWDARHKNPDLVAGFDPGKAGLNEYLANELYGQDWYHYSGNQFTNEVGSDAKARVSELLRDIETRREIPGYITRTQVDGATSQEVAAAANAVRNGTVDQLKDGSVEKMLAGILESHLQSTGAKENLDPDEYSRLVEYGISGLSQAIGNTEKKDLQDYAWKIAQDDAASEREWQRKKDYALWERGLKAPQSLGNTGITYPMESAGYRDWVKSTEKQASKYIDGNGQHVDYRFTNWDGTSDFAVNEYDMSDKLYNTPERQSIRQSYNGFDILHPDKEIRLEYEDGTPIILTTGKFKSDEEARKYGVDKDYGIAVYYNGELEPNATTEINNALYSTRDHINRLKSKNPDIEKYAISPNDQYEMREKNDYPATADWSDFYDYMSSKEYRGDFSAGILANTDDQYKKPLAAFNGAFISEWNAWTNQNGGKAGKDSRAVIYELDETNAGRGKKSYTDAADVLGMSKDGQLQPTITNIAMTTEDFFENRPMIRFQTSARPGKVFMVDAGVFGTAANTMINEMSSEVKQILDPIVHPRVAMRMSQEQNSEWSAIANALLRDSGYKLPEVVLPNGKRRSVTPLEAMHDERYRNQIKLLVLAGIIEPGMQDIRTSIGLGAKEQ